VLRLRERVENVGVFAVDAVRAALELWMVFVSTIAGLIRSRRSGRPRGEIARQMHAIGNKSLLFIVVTLGFIGMVMIYQACLQIRQITGDLSQVGAQFLPLIISDFAPTLTGMMLATRVGAGIAAEIGSMKVTEQVDALRMSGVLPVDYLVVPRFVASVIMTVVLSVIAAAVTYTMGGLTAQYQFDVNPRLFFDFSQVKPAHLGLGVVKAIAYGMAIPVVSGFCGLRAKGSSEGVGWATTAAVIGSSFAVIALDFVISVAGFFVVGDAL
jgi:phospholipid/cholesterol/gamma-HCH transport system permease protein